MRRILVFLALFALPLFAADLGKYKNWNESPAGYYMTKAEREQWSKLAGENEAARFVEEFLARRDPGFSAEVTKRAEMADKYLALGKTPASKTLRGKIIVLFGPPSGVNVADRTDTDVKHDNPAMTDALSNAGSSGGGKSDNSTNLGSTTGSSRTIRTYTLTFSGDLVTKTLGRKDVAFTVDADSVSGKDRIAGRSGAKEAEELFEKVAQASIVREWGGGL